MSSRACRAFRLQCFLVKFSSVSGSGTVLLDSLDEPPRQLHAIFHASAVAGRWAKPLRLGRSAISGEAREICAVFGIFRPFGPRCRRRSDPARFQALDA